LTPCPQAEILAAVDAACIPAEWITTQLAPGED